MECALLLLLLWVGRDSTAAGAGGSMASGIRLQLEGTTNYYEGRRLKIGLMLDLEGFFEESSPPLISGKTPWCD